MMEAMVYDKGWMGYAWRCFAAWIACAYVSVRGLDGYDMLASNGFLVPVVINKVFLHFIPFKPSEVE